MTINMKEIKKGSVLHLRCGGKIEVTEEPSISYDWAHIPVVSSNQDTISFDTKTGGWDNMLDEHPFDIIKIDPPGFDWNEVEWGMAFKTQEDGLVYTYIGQSTTYEFDAVVQNASTKSLFTMCKQYLIRSPEHDIKVKK